MRLAYTILFVYIIAGQLSLCTKTVVEEFAENLSKELKSTLKTYKNEDSEYGFQFIKDVHSNSSSFNSQRFKLQYKFDTTIVYEAKSNPKEYEQGQLNIKLEFKCSRPGTSWFTKNTCFDRYCCGDVQCIAERSFVPATFSEKPEKVFGGPGEANWSLEVLKTGACQGISNAVKSILNAKVPISELQHNLKQLLQ